MNKKRRKKVVKDLGSIKFNGSFERLGEPSQVEILNNLLNGEYEEQPQAVKSNLSETMQNDFERLCLQGMLILPEELFKLDVDQRDIYIRSLLNKFKAMETLNQVSSTNVYYITKACSFGDCWAKTPTGDITFREKSISMFKKYWYSDGEDIPDVEPYVTKQSKKQVHNVDGMDITVTDNTQTYEHENDIDSEVESIMKINRSKKKQVKKSESHGVLTQKERLDIGDDLLSGNYYLNLTDDPTKPGVWYNPFLDDINDLVVTVNTNDIAGNPITYDKRRIDYRYVPDWHWNRCFLKSFNGSLKMEWTAISIDSSSDKKSSSDEGKYSDRTINLKSVYNGNYFDNNPNEVMSSEFLTNVDESMQNATLELAKRITKEKKDFLAGKINGIPEGGFTKEFIESLKLKGFGRKDRYINYCDNNSKHAYQDERISPKRRRELEGFDLMRSTPSNCNTARAYILAHRQLLKGATLVFENGREFDESPWGDMDPIFFDKVRNPLHIKSGFELYEGIRSGVIKYQGVKIPRYAGQSIVIGSSPFIEVRKLETDLERVPDKKVRKKLKKKIAKKIKECENNIRTGNSNVITSYEMSADWHDVYKFDPDAFEEVIRDVSIDVDEFLDKYRDAERRKYDPAFQPPVYSDEFLLNVNPIDWITPDIEKEMSNKLANSAIPDSDNSTGKKIIKQMEKALIGDGKDPDSIKLLASMKKKMAPKEKSSDYKWAEDTKKKFRGVLHSSRRISDHEMTVHLASIYSDAESRYIADMLSGNKTRDKSIEDYAIDLLKSRGIDVMDNMDQDDIFVDDCDIIGSSSHFITVYVNEQADEEVDEIKKELGTFKCTKKKIGDKLSKKKRKKKADQFDQLLSNTDTGSSIKFNDNRLTDIMINRNLLEYSDNEVDKFNILRDNVAMSIAKSYNQPLPKYYKDIVNKRILSSKKKFKKKQSKKTSEARIKAVKDGLINPLDCLEMLINEENEYIKTKKGKKKKSKEIIKYKAGIDYKNLEKRFNSERPREAIF